MIGTIPSLQGFLIKKFDNPRFYTSVVAKVYMHSPHMHHTYNNSIYQTFPETEDRVATKLICPNTVEFKKRAQSLLVVVSSEPSSSYEQFTNKVRKYNTLEPFKFRDSVFGNKFNKVGFNLF